MMKLKNIVEKKGMSEVSVGLVIIIVLILLALVILGFKISAFKNMLGL
jgi:hypothetical protein